MNILTENNQVLNWDHYRQLEVQQRVRQQTTGFEVTAYHSTTPQTVVVRRCEMREEADAVIDDFFRAIKKKATAWDAMNYEVPTTEPEPEPVETPEADDVPPPSE